MHNIFLIDSRFVEGDSNLVHFVALNENGPIEENLAVGVVGDTLVAVRVCQARTVRIGEVGVENFTVAVDVTIIWCCWWSALSLFGNRKFKTEN